MGESVTPAENSYQSSNVYMTIISNLLSLISFYWGHILQPKSFLMHTCQIYHKGKNAIILIFKFRTGVAFVVTECVFLQKVNETSSSRESSGKNFQQTRQLFELLPICFVMELILQDTETSLSFTGKNGLLLFTFQ